MDKDIRKHLTITPIRTIQVQHCNEMYLIMTLVLLYKISSIHLIYSNKPHLRILEDIQHVLLARTDFHNNCQVLLHQTYQTVFTCLPFALGHCHFESERVFPQSIATNLKEQCPNCFGMLRYLDCTSLEMRFDLATSIKTASYKCSFT